MKRELEFTVTFSDPPYEFVHIEDILIPDEYLRTRVGKNKVRWAKEYIQRNGYFDKPISVIAETNERGKSNVLMLYDEYSRYRAAVELGLTEVPVKYIDIRDIEL